MPTLDPRRTKKPGKLSRIVLVGTGIILVAAVIEPVARYVSDAINPPPNPMSDPRVREIYAASKGSPSRLTPDQRAELESLRRQGKIPADFRPADRGIAPDPATVRSQRMDEIRTRTRGDWSLLTPDERSFLRSVGAQIPDSTNPQ